MIKDVMRRAIRSAVEKANGKIVIGQATPIQMGFVVALLGFVLGCVWWAATINAKLDLLVGKVDAAKDISESNRLAIDSLKLWKAEIDRSGSKAVDALKSEFEQFKMDFRVHCAKGSGP